MSLLETLLHPEIILALILFLAVSIAVEIIAYRVLNILSEVRASEWIIEHAVVPGARTLALVVFLLIAYPVLFGMTEAPTITELLVQGRSRLMTLVNIIFVLSLLLPLVPVISRMPALILPVQAIAAASLMFHWWAKTQSGIEIRFWPGWGTVLALLILAFLTHEIAKWLGRVLEHHIDILAHREGSGALIYRSVVMVMQVPVILIYTLSLGRQIV